jgi:hypothetical protein
VLLNVLLTIVVFTYEATYYVKFYNEVTLLLHLQAQLDLLVFDENYSTQVQLG